ncbi:MAG: heavy metal translocating P-type ATPase [Chloroflexota bacterium]
MHHHIDPLFGRERHEQLHALAADGELSDVQRRANHLLAWGTGGMVLAGGAALLGLPAAWVAVPFGLVEVWPGVKIAYSKAVVERRLSMIHLGLLYAAGMYLTGHLVAAAGGLFIAAAAYKLMALSETTMRERMIDIFGRQARYAWRLVDGIETEVPIEQVIAGDILVVDAGQTIPVDGVIVQGAASIDQHMLTGEAQPAEKTAGDPVLAATVLLSGRIYVQVQKAGAQTTAAQIGEILNRSATHRLSIEEKIVQAADRSLKPMLMGSGLGLLLAGPASAVAVFGCNFTLNMLGATPHAMLIFLNRSSAAGILVKEGEALEKLQTVDTVVFDKTGTLTVEQPHVVRIHPCASFDAAGVLRLAAAAERRQSHPIAQAIVEEAQAQQLSLPVIEDAHYEIGYGIKARLLAAAFDEPQAKAELPAGEGAAETEWRLIRVGSLRFLEMEGLAVPAQLQTVAAECQAQGHSLVLAGVDDAVIGAIELQSTVRSEAREVVHALQQRGMQTYIISGDQEGPTRTLAHELGTTGYFANTLPEHKAKLVEQLKAEGRRVCYIGDGINDALALKKADVSVSLRGATTAATDTAQVVLMDADLSQLLVLLNLVDEMHANLKLNYNSNLAISLVSVGSVLLLQASFAAVQLFFMGSVLTSVTIANLPLLKQKFARSDDSATQE